LVDAEKVKIAPTPLDAVADAEALILATEWQEFANQDFEQVKAKMHTPLIFDGRNHFDPQTMRGFGFTYHAIGRPTSVSQ
jgi:UDPglucose 6-dehydrogenase